MLEEIVETWKNCREIAKNAEVSRKKHENRGILRFFRDFSGFLEDFAGIEGKLWELAINVRGSRGNWRKLSRNSEKCRNFPKKTRKSENSEIFSGFLRFFGGILAELKENFGN